MGQVISSIIFGPPKSTTSPLLLPDASSPDLGLCHPTDDENTSIWELTAEAWKDALNVPQYLEESVYLMTIPLAKDGGMTQWILVDTKLPPNKRLILASCETFRKRSLISDPAGNVAPTVTHGIASLFVAPELRRQGYATRFLKELRTVLPGWQAEKTRPVTGSVLFSDIGKQFYADRSWRPFPSYHLEFDAAAGEWQGSTPVLADQVGRLCEEDEAMIQRAMSRPQSSPNMRFIILPDPGHMLWHHRKEEFVARKLFGREPHIKGAIAGPPGNRVWPIWTHRFYGPPDDESSGNTLYILRIVIESQLWPTSDLAADDASDNEKQLSPPLEELKAILRAAQAEAAEWKLQQVHLWDPSSHLEDLVGQTGIRFCGNHREEEEISCIQWYGNCEVGLDWLGNEKYAWC